MAKATSLLWDECLSDEITSNGWLIGLEHYVAATILGDYCGGVPPLPIPNREVKPTSADGTAEMWESRSSPSF